MGSRRVRSLFAAAKKKAPCIVFIDEIDAVGGSRKQWENHTRKTLNQLLTEMDGFDANEGVIVMAATNLQVFSVYEVCNALSFYIVTVPTHVITDLINTASSKHKPV